MSEMSRNARRMMRAKAHRLSQETTGRVDASDYGPEENMHADVKTGMRPISRRAFKAGGKVEGETGKPNAGKMPRTARATGGKALVEDWQNRNIKDANEKREGVKHVGGFARGGRPKGEWSDEAKAAAKQKTRSTLGSGVPKGGYSPAQGLASKLQRMTRSEREWEAPKGAWEEQMQRLPRSGGRQKAHDLYGGRKVTSEKEYANGGGINFRDRMRSAALTKGRQDGPGGSSYKRRPGASQDVVETHHTGLGTERKLMGKTGKFNIDHKGNAVAEWKEKAGPIPRKSGGRAKRADGGNAGDMVPTGLLPSTNASSRMTKAAGLKSGGTPPVPKPSPKPTPSGTNGLNIPKGGYNDPYEPTPPAPRKSGGRAPFEGTARDKREDKLLAAKHHETFKEWEASAADRKHDKQRSMKGLKTGGWVDDGTRPVGGRKARKSGGWIKDAIKHPGALHRELGVPEGKKILEAKLEKAEHSDNPKLAKRARLAETLKRMNRKDGGRAKGKTNITIVVGSGQQPGNQMPPPGGPSGAPVPVGPPPLGAVGAPIPGGPPAGPVPGAPPPAMLPPAGAPMPRKSGGRTVHMTAGAGSGEGRLEKTALEKRKK